MVPWCAGQALHIGRHKGRPAREGSVDTPGPWVLSDPNTHMAPIARSEGTGRAPDSPVISKPALPSQAQLRELDVPAVAGVPVHRFLLSTCDSLYMYGNKFKLRIRTLLESKAFRVKGT